MASVYFDPSVGGNGTTVTDDSNPTTGLANGGHRTRFVPALGQLVAVANYTVNYTQARVNDCVVQVSLATAQAVLAGQSATTALNAPGTQATSVTSLAVGLGSRSLTLAQTGKAFVVGQYVQIVNSTTAWMVGLITAFNSGTGAMTVNVTNSGGSGTLASWTVTPTNPPEIPSQSGNAGRFLRTDGSNESWELPFPVQTGQAGKFLSTDGTNASWQPILESFIASGAITQGGVLQLRSNGTVEQVAGVAPSTGSTVALKASNTQSGAVAVSSTGTVVIAFPDSTNSNRLSVVVGTVSGTSISFGTAVQVNTDSPGGISVAFMNATNFCIHYGLPASLTSQAVIGTVSGTTATFGTKQQVFSSSGGNFTPLAKVIWMPNVSRLLFAGYIEPSAMSFDMVARAASVSGTVMTLGTQINVSTNTGSFSDLVFHDGAGRAFFAWVGSGSTTILGRVLSVSGTSVSLGGQVTFVTGSTSASRVALAYDSVSQRILSAWLNNSSVFTSHVSISGTTPSILATSSALGSGTDFALDFSVTGNRFLLRYRTSGTAFLQGVRVSGTSFLTDPLFSYSSTVQSLGSGGAYSATANKLIVNHTDSSGTLVAVAQVIQPLESNLETGAKVLGISQATVADGVSVPVAILGNVDANQSGLTVNADYYVNYLGALTTTAGGNVLLGRAVAATKLLVTKGS